MLALSIAAAIAGLALLVLIHEAGHYLAARAVGMRPRRFFLFLDPALWSKTIGGCEFGIGTVPLGGYVTLPGMRRPTGGDLSRLRSLAEALHELEPPLAALEERVGEEKVAAEAVLSALADLERELAQLSGVPPKLRRRIERQLAEIGAAFDGRAYWRMLVWRRLVIVAAGPAANLLAAFLLLTLSYAALQAHPSTTVDAVASGSPAALAGLRPGDRLAVLSGQRVRTEKQLGALISATGGRPFSLVVSRHGRPVQLGPLQARRQGQRFKIGITLGYYRSGEPLGRALPDAARTLWRVWVAVATGDAAAALVSGRHGAGNSVSDPVGIVQISSQTIRLDPLLFPAILALISLSLGLLNLLPLPPLDGGQMLLALAEALLRRPLRARVHEVSLVAGGIVVVAIFLLGFWNDLGHLGGR